MKVYYWSIDANRQAHELDSPLFASKEKAMEWFKDSVYLKSGESLVSEGPTGQAYPCDDLYCFTLRHDHFRLTTSYYLYDEDVIE